MDPVLLGNGGEGLSGANGMHAAFGYGFLAEQGEILFEEFLSSRGKLNLELGAVGGSFFFLEGRIKGLNFGQIYFRSLGDQLQSSGGGNHNFLIKQGRMVVDIGEAILLGLAGNEDRCQEHGDVLFCLFSDIPVPRDLPEILTFGPFHGPQDLSLPGIIAGGHQIPVVEHPIEASQVFSGGVGGFLWVAALIDPFIHFESKPSGSLGYELPDAAGLGPGKGFGVIPAFDQSQVKEFFRKVLLPQNPLHHLFVGLGTAQSSGEKIFALGLEKAYGLFHFLVEEGRESGRDDRRRFIFRAVHWEPVSSQAERSRETSSKGVKSSWERLFHSR